MNVLVPFDVRERIYIITYYFTLKCTSHKNVHKKKKPIFVSFCFQQNELLYGEEGTCTLCSKTFARKSSLLTHMRNHTAERKYHCSHCQKGKQNMIFNEFLLIYIHLYSICFKYRLFFLPPGRLYSGSKPSQS